MRDDLFDELAESVKEAGAYLRGEQAPARVSSVDEPDPRAIRERLGLTQEEFAAALAERAGRAGSREEFLRLLDKVPDVEPAEHDRI